jgi:hypothetical protein
MTSGKNRADLDQSMRKIGESPEQFGEVLDEISAKAATPTARRSMVGAAVAAIAGMTVWVMRRRRTRKNTTPWQHLSQRARSQFKTAQSRAARLKARVRH